MHTLFMSEGVEFRAPCYMCESSGARAKGRGGAYLLCAALPPQFAHQSRVARTPRVEEGGPAWHVLSTGAPTGGALSGGSMLPHPSLYASTHEGGRCQQGR